MADANAKTTRRLALAGRLTIIGGGVMGLVTAYYAAPLAEAVTVLDRSRVGDPATASFGLTRLVTRVLREALRIRGVTLAENTEPQAITRRDRAWVVATESGPVESDALVITAGLGTNDVLGPVPGCSVRFPLRPDRPTQSKYFIPPPGSRDMFTESVMPVFAYLDIGIYGHPLAGVDACWYDLVADGEFILGAVPGTDDVFTGVGWRGTGYKFAPWVGKVLAQVAVPRGTVFDIGRFTPAGFAGGAIGEPLAGGVAS
jgi:glycine/D-amino acid oxidase-like deaminating enzyme